MLSVQWFSDFWCNHFEDHPECWEGYDDNDDDTKHALVVL